MAEIPILLPLMNYTGHQKVGSSPILSQLKLDQTDYKVV